jgi:LuxR family transcriptional regulator, maltose regulon positive regulatory protein
MPDQQQPIQQQTIRVFGQAQQPAYERTVAMREVSFTCIVCQKQVTQLRYPGPSPRYCSEDCRAERANILNQERVRKQREKRQAARAARSKITNAAHIPYDHHIPNSARFSYSEQHTSTTLPPLLASRLSPPRLPVLLVERARLLALLDAGQKQKLTLLQAPAGFGKTTLVNQWLAHRQEQVAVAAQNPSPVAWISLESDDNDPIRFWTSMIVACQSFHEQIGQTALAHLSQAHRLLFPPSLLETTLTLLLNDLTRFVQEGVLILEDYHLIEHARIHETLAFFIEHLPASLHIVMLTRSEPPLPLVRWRARGDLLEVHSSQLRFSMRETALFLQQIISQTPQRFSDEAVSLLHAHLEGWAAGLRLLALSLQGLMVQMTPQAVESYLLQLNSGFPASRSHRPIQEYFMSEVFSTLPEDLQFFLLQTSMLSRLTGPLCDVVTGRQDCAQWLELAERSGFFLEAVDSTGQWYRYHALFAETMRAEAAHRLGAEELRRLSRQASRWYEEHAMLVEAIETALYAQECEHAAVLIEGLSEEACFSEQLRMLRWLEQMPISLLRAHPALCFRYALTRYASEVYDISQLRVERIEELLKMAEESWREQGAMAHIGVLYGFRATLTMLLGNQALGVTYAHQALQLMPRTKELPDMQLLPVEWIDWRCGCLIALGQEAMQEGGFERAHQLMLEAYTLSQNNIERTFPRISCRLLGTICLALGELHQAVEYYQQTIAEIGGGDEMGDDIVHTFCVCGLAWLSYEWNHLARTEQLAREVSEYRYSSHLTLWEEEVRMHGDLVRLLVLRARGETAAVLPQLSALFVRLQASSFSNTKKLIPDVLAWQVRWQIVDGDLAAARRTLSILADYDKELPPLHLQTVQLLRARLLLARGETTAALHSLGQLLITALEGKHITRALEIQLVIALAHAAAGQEQKARHWLSEVLSQARNEGFMRLFLDEGEPLARLLRQLVPTIQDKALRSYAQSILRAFATTTEQGHASTPDGAPFEPLSAQEQRVLRLLAAGHTNQEIARVLIVSVNTVKDHVKHLYRKLGVNNRLQASEAARHLKIDQQPRFS